MECVTRGLIGWLINAATPNKAVLNTGSHSAISSQSVAL